MGEWKEGYALDLHTLSSEFIGDDEFGHPRFVNTYSDIGDLLYKLKSTGDTNAVPRIVKAVENFLKTWNPGIDIIIPVPASNKRVTQPVMLMAESISKQLEIPLVDCVTRTRDIKQLKNISDFDERLKLLEGLHKVDKTVVQGKKVLLFDDLYRSGATMNAITTELYERGKAADVFALTITRTRSKQ